MKEQLQRAKQALEAEAAPAQDAAPAPVAGRAQARAKKADEYHARHRGWVAEFNELTGGECAGGEAGVKWAAVRAWQQKHWQLNNLLADGLVGPKTLEAAKLLAKKDAPKPEQDGAGDGKQKEPEAPQPGHAEAAEASADKPTLDAEEEPDAQLKPATAGASKSQQPISLAEFEQQLHKIELLLAQFKPPQGRGPLKSVAEDMMGGKGDAGAPEPTGAMMSGLDSYLGEAAKLVDRWGQLDAQDRADFLLHAINRVLALELVPAIHKTHLATREGTAASFDADNWILDVDPVQFGVSLAHRPDKKSYVDKLASTVFHEGRHAEQRFAVARLLARKSPGITRSQIQEQAHVHEDIAGHAIKLESQHKAPVSAAEDQSAERMAGDVVGKAGEEHAAIEHLIPQIGAAGTAAKEMLDRLSPDDRQAVAGKWQEIRARMVVALDAYYQLPTEQDAYAAEKKLDDKVK